MQPHGLYVAHQAPLSMELFRQEYWTVFPFPSPGDLPNPGVEFMSPALAGGFFATEPPGKPLPLFTHLQNEDIQVDPLDPSRAQSLQVKVFN